MRIPLPRRALALLLVAVAAFAAAPAGAQLPGTGTGAEAQADADAGAPAGPSAERARALADVLRDDAARAALIEELERLAAAPEGEATGAEDASSDPAAAEPETSLPREIAAFTQAAAEDAAAAAMAVWTQLKAAPGILSGLGRIDPALIVDALAELAAVIAGTVAVYLVLRGAGRRAFRAMGEAAEGAGTLRAGLILLASIVMDAATVLLAWAAGYLIALTAVGEFGTIGIRQSLYLNAFLLVEMARVGLRAILSPTTSHLRIVPIPDIGARRMARGLGFAASLIGYGQLLVVPIVNRGVSFFAGGAVAALLALAALAVLTSLVLRNRRATGAWLASTRIVETGPSALKGLARNWHVPVLIYLAGLLFLVVTRPGGVLTPVLIASGQLLAAVVAAAALSGALSRWTAQGVHLPDRLTAPLPLLEKRLNAFLPVAASAARLLIFLLAAGFAAHTLGALDARGWLESQVGLRVTGAIVSVALILTFTFAIWLAVSSWIDYRLNPDAGRVATPRERTLLTLLRNAATIAIVVITLMFTLSEIGIDIAPLIASAGVLGLAIGFGAQKLVQDIITGIFIQLENAMNVGDVVTVGATTGVVERLTIRSVSLRDVSGTFHIIPFSSVDMVSNFMRDFAFHVADIGIAYRESLEDAKQAMFDAFEELRRDPDVAPNILGDMQWFGLNAFGASELVVRARIKCAPGQQWGVGRAYNALVKRIFDERGIEIPFPHQTIYFGEDKQGSAPPLRIANKE